MLVGEIDTKSSFKIEGKIGEPTNVELALAPGKATSTVPAPAPTLASTSYVGTNRAAAGMATASTENIYSAPMAVPSTINPYMQKQGEISSGANPSVALHQMSNQDEANSSFTPISALSPYQNTYILTIFDPNYLMCMLCSYLIKARVTSKSDIKTWAKEKSSGKLFSVNLIDSSVYNLP